ncbi:putative secreted protein (Por secretion system target) [Flavobacteriaceae bacterium MAR_2010_72]|nr:putative secreted protein (Por secretion system target) [Flavobacteriaceae bacterium MAR_2010_72]
MGIYFMNYSWSQNIVAAEYFFDVDPGVGLTGNSFAITPNTDIDETFEISTSGLSDGLHVLHIRTQDDNGTWSLYLRQYFFVNTGSDYNNPPEYNIVEAEYFFDTDTGVGNAGIGNIGGSIPLTPNATIDENFAIPTTGLSNGLHVLHIRTKDENNTWSLYLRHYFFVNSGNDYVDPPEYNIVEAEYFFDTDTGVGNAGLGNIGGTFPLTPNSVIDENFAIPTTGLSDGLHVLHIRTKDENNTWSLYERRYFFINSENDYVDPPEYTIVEAEYFFDTDTGVGNAGVGNIGGTFPLTPNAKIDENFVIPTTGLSEGLHVLHIRTKDENNTWSLFERRYLYISDIAPNSNPVPIIAAEYFLNSDPGVGNGTPIIVTEGMTIDQTLEIPMACIDIGDHVLHIRVKDQNNTWSLYKYQTFSVEQDMVPPTTICKDIIVELDASGNASITVDDIDDGSDDSCGVVTKVLDKTTFNCDDLGTVQVTLTVTDTNGNEASCISNVTVKDITPPTAITQNITVELNNTGVLTIPEDAVNNGSSDICSELTFDTSKTTFDCNDLGDNTVTLTVRDASGNESFANAIVTVIDASPPTVSTKNITVVLDANGLASIAEDAVNLNSGDSCSTITFDTDITEFNCTNVGQNTVTLTASDNNGNSASADAIVTVEDNTVPTVLCQDITVQLDQTGSVSIAPEDVDNGSSDNCGIFSLGLDKMTFDCSDIGPNTVTLTVTDVNGKIATCTSVVTVQDTTNPTITAADDISEVTSTDNLRLCDAEISIPDALITDNCSANFSWEMTGAVETTGTGQIGTFVFPIGETTITYAISGGNSDIMTVTLTDDEEPSISTVTDFNVNLTTGCDFTIPDYTNLVSTSDNCGTPNVTQSPTIGTVISGHNTEQVITLTAMDGSGNSKQTTFKITLLGTEIFYLDNDNDTFGDPNNSIIDCETPLGYVSNNTDCDDTNSTINPAAQTLSFSTSTNFTSSLVYPLNGSPETNFQFEVIYTDSNNELPPGSFPRVLLDYEGNGVFNNSNDRIIVMSPTDVNDLNTNDGKRYFATINALPTGTNWETSVQIYSGSCVTKIGPFNYPDVQIQPDLEIFADDITFSENNPAVSSPITVYAEIHNRSDFSINNFKVKLINQFDGTQYPDITVANITPRSSKIVSWDIITPNVDSWNPLQVVVDSDHVIVETNENNNSAVRPIIVGDVELPGEILVSAEVNPVVSYSSPGARIYINGYGYYDNTAVPLDDPSVAGGFISFTIQETGANYTTHTNENGNWNSSFPAPQVPGIYHVIGTLTDFTLTGNFESTFEILLPVQSCLPDLISDITASETLINVGESVTISTIIKNVGCAPTTIDSWANMTQNGGTPEILDVLVGPLDPQEFFSLNPEILTFNTAGTYQICAQADGTYLIEESNEYNNTDCITIKVRPNTIDIVPNGGPNGSAFLCSDPTPSFSVKNIGGIASGPFTSSVIVLFGGNEVYTHTEEVASLNPQEVHSFSIGYSYLETGTYDFILECDIPVASAGVVNESDELNNVGNYTAEIIACKPDLSINCNTVKVNPVNPEHPSTHIYSATILNSGNAIAIGPIEVSFTRSDTNIPAIITYEGDINPNQKVTIEYSVASVAPATETLEIRVDPNNLIEEFNESNNDYMDNLCWDFETVPVCGTNFWNKSYVLNQNINLYVGVNSNDLYDATNLKVKFEVSGPGITGNLDLGNAIIEDAHKTCGCPLVAVLPYGYVFNQTGIYTFTMTSDPDNEFTECDETNNVLVRSVNVTANKPDLSITSEFINPSILNPDINELVNIDISYENLGLSNIDDIMQLDVLIDEVLIESLPNANGLITGGTNTLSLSAPWSSNISGVHIIRAIIDASEIVDETNELNNEATRAIIVGPSVNLKINSFTSNNYSPDLNDDILLDIIIENEGELDCTADLKLSYLDDFQNEIFITSIPISLLGTSTITLNDIPWNVLDSYTTLVATIINSSVAEYTYDDNTASLNIGSFQVNIEATPSCNENPGSLVATAVGGNAPYTYVWEDDTIGNTFTSGPGIYHLVVTDHTGFITSLDAEIVTTLNDADCDGVPTSDDCDDNDPNITTSNKIDSDNDGVNDCEDLCPGFDDTVDIDGDGIPYGCDDCIDSDNDTVCDSVDVCPGFNDLADADNDGIPDGCDTCDDSVDTDNDGVNDCDDLCPNDPDKIAPGDCGCGTPDTDSDSDGTLDCDDLCPNDPNKIEPGVCGCNVADIDSDGDGTLDCDDLCPNDPNKTDPGVCGCDVADIDSDGDGTLDCDDLCPNDPDKIVPGDCGCGIADTDSDSDGTPDCLDNCPNDPNKTDPGVCGCDVADIDSDGDGTLDCDDLCPNDPDKIAPGDCGCGIADTDSDNDGTPDCLDNCPNDPDKIDPGVCGCDVADTDSDGDGIPDCNDTCDGSIDNDNDGVNDCDDLCPNDPDKITPGDCGCGTPDNDSDGDGTPDCLDNCPNDPNKIDPGVCGCDVADIDSDGDGTLDCDDLCPNDPDKIAPGDCGCGIADTDSDNDGTPDCLDNCPNDPNKTDPGVCGCDVADIDSDGDGTLDCDDLCPNDPDKIAPGDCGCGIADTDSDGDGTPDCDDLCPNDPNKIDPGVCGCDIADIDSDSDGTPDCDDLCPNDPDKIAPGDCGCGTADTDSDGDGTPDCDDLCPNDPDKIAPGDCGCGIVDTDSDGDGTPDCDDLCPTDPDKIAPGDCGCGTTDTDSDGDTVPDCNDICEGYDDLADADNDGIPDGCDTGICYKPIINDLSLPTDPVQLSLQINGSATVENGIISQVSWNWGDGQTTNGTINGNNVSGNHTYTSTGVYEVTLTVANDCGMYSTIIFQYIVIYDPSSGFVTGGGWIDSPIGAYVPEPDLTGKATFGFVSKYKPGRNRPDGNTEFQFHAGNLNFKSSSYDWLIVSGQRAQFKGDGTINGQGDYKFILTAIDGDKNDTVDKFRIKIWNAITEDIVYDNQLGHADSEDPSTSLAGGSIMVHTGKNKNRTTNEEPILKEDGELAGLLEIDFWPNPSNSTFNLRVKKTDMLNNIHIYVFDVTNKLVHYNEFNSEEDYSFGKELESGVYIVKISQGSKSLMKRLIKY